jgi:hypothetical protein
VETKKEKKIRRRKKWNNWRETKTGLFVFLFFSLNFFPLRGQVARTEMAARIQDNFVQKSSNDGQPRQRTNSFFKN